jgi:hypothetical protein
MLRKLLLTTSIIIWVVTLLKAQPCTPGNYTASGIYPDTITNLPKAYVSYPYSTTVTCVIPKDTVVSPITWTIDSIGITNITGMPANFTYFPSRVSGYWPGNSKGCILISGTATAGEIGIHKIKIFTKTYVSYSFLSDTQLDTVNGYKINIQDSSLTGINRENEQDDISFIFNSNNINIHSATVIHNASIIVYDITGRELMHLNNLNGNDFTINKDKFLKGIYIISFMNAQKIIARRKFIIG